MQRSITIKVDEWERGREKKIEFPLFSVVSSHVRRFSYACKLEWIAVVLSGKLCLSRWNFKHQSIQHCMPDHQSINSLLVKDVGGGARQRMPVLNVFEPWWEVASHHSGSLSQCHDSGADLLCVGEEELYEKLLSKYKCTFVVTRERQTESQLFRGRVINCHFLGLVSFHYKQKTFTSPHAWHFSLNFPTLPQHFRGHYKSHRPTVQVYIQRRRLCLRFLNSAAMVIGEIWDWKWWKKDEVKVNSIRHDCDNKFPRLHAHSPYLLLLVFS